MINFSNRNTKINSYYVQFSGNFWQTAPKKCKRLFLNFLSLSQFQIFVQPIWRKKIQITNTSLISSWIVHHKNFVIIICSQQAETKIEWFDRNIIQIVSKVTLLPTYQKKFSEKDMTHKFDLRRQIYEIHENSIEFFWTFLL